MYLTGTTDLCNHFTLDVRIYMFLKVFLADLPDVWLAGLTGSVKSSIFAKSTVLHSSHMHSLSHSACFEPCYLSWTNTVSCGKRPADLRVVPKSKHDNFLRGKLVTSSKRSLGYPSFCTSRTSSCKKEKKQKSSTPYNIFYTGTKAKIKSSLMEATDPQL